MSFSRGLALLVAAFVGIGPAPPLPVLLVLLVASGVFRSVGFSAYNTLQFADVEANNANTLASALQQVATALGLAVVAVFVRASTAVSAPEPPAEGHVNAPRTAAE